MKNTYVRQVEPEKWFALNQRSATLGLCANWHNGYDVLTYNTSSYNDIARRSMIQQHNTIEWIRRSGNVNSKLSSSLTLAHFILLRLQTDGVNVSVDPFCPSRFAAFADERTGAWRAASHPQSSFAHPGSASAGGGVYGKCHLSKERCRPAKETPRLWSGVFLFQTPLPGSSTRADSNF